MSDEARVTAAVLAADLESLKLLYDYTKFHIGFYLTLASGFITIASLKKGEGFALDLKQNLVWIAMGLFMLAGFAGGIIVSSITQCLGLTGSETPDVCRSTHAFLKQDLGPWRLKWFSGRVWTEIEHTAFWAGLAAAFFSFKSRAATAETAKAPLAVKIEGAIEVKNAA